MQIPKMPTLGQAIQENMPRKRKVRSRKVKEKGRKRLEKSMDRMVKEAMVEREKNHSWGEKRRAEGQRLIDKHFPPKGRKPRKGETIVLIKHQGKPDEVKVVRSDEELEKVRQQLKDTDYIMVKDQDLAGTRVTHKSPTFGGRRAKFSKKRQAVG
jgi:hypothetical protein